MLLRRSTIVRVAVLIVPAAAAALALGMAGRGSTTPSSKPRAPTYYQDIKPILDGRCTGCHYQGGIAPFALTSYADAYRHRAFIAYAVSLRLMPPWLAAGGYRRYLYDPSLSAQQIASITRWAAHGGPKGDPARAAPSLPSVAPRLSRVDVRLPMPRRYTPRRRLGADDYHCFVLPWSAGRPRYVTGFNVKPGRQREVHHIILYLAPPAEAATVDGWDAADPGPGYRCYGGPSATGHQQIPVQLLAGWVPGSSGTDFPAGTGIRILPGSRLILQIHYNLTYTDPKPDRSVVELKLDHAVAKRGFYVPVFDARWFLSPATFTIPAGQSHVVHTFTGDPRTTLRYFAGDFDASRGFVIHSALFHMHRLGKGGQITIERSSGSREVLLSLRRWSFHWQREYWLADPVPFAPGDRLSIRCVHDNSAAHQPVVNGRKQRPRTVTWGENSSDEMCIGFLYVSEP